MVELSDWEDACEAENVVRHLPYDLTFKVDLVPLPDRTPMIWPWDYVVSIRSGGGSNLISLIPDLEKIVLEALNYYLFSIGALQLMDEAL